MQVFWRIDKMVRAECRGYQRKIVLDPCAHIAIDKRNKT